MSKNIQMPMEFVMDVYRLILRLDESKMDSGTKTLCKRIEAQVEAKIDAMARREVYTRYKTGVPGSDEREEARHEYLERAGISKSFQTSKEINSE